jgi:putative ABC transport system permease protein
MALGANSGNVLRNVLGRGFALVGTGLAIGLGVSLGMTRLIGGLLYQVGAADPVTFAAAIFVLAVVALIACWIPALRATKVDPIVALRYE